MNSIKKPSSIYHNGSPSEDPCASYHLVFMITGNPGLMSYYTTFLSTLNKLITEIDSNSIVFEIYGQSLAGFEKDDLLPPTSCAPYSLEDQIEILFQALNERTISSGPREGQKHDHIVLMGHSVGAYIVMELLARLRKTESSLTVKAGILLFPTVTHLAKSPSGVKFSSIFKIPGFSKSVSMLGKIMLWPLPKPALKWLVGKALGMPEESAETTTEFLKSNLGIWQAL
jgi:pimeloyl-ACP methyl ester carboxylesterase